MEQNSAENFKLRALREAGIAYSVSAVLPVLASALLMLILIIFGVQTYENAEWYVYLSYLLPQLCFAGAVAIYFTRSKVSFKKTYCGCKWYYFALAILMQFGLLFSLSELNNYFIGFLKLFGYKETGVPLPSLEGWNLLPAILVIAVLPALLEETVFRGILSRQMYENGWGVLPAVLISGALFSLFHHNPVQTAYQFVCGACFTLVALKSGSVLPTIAAHFLNNAAILILEATGYGASWDFGFGGYLAICLVSAACLVGVLVFLLFFDKNNAQKGGVKHGKIFFLAAAVGIAVSAVEWIALFVQGLL